jgi:tetratricopeptide (TPR) repeat protein
MKRILLFFAFSVLSIVLFAQKHSKESKVHASQAKKYFDNGDYRKALNFYLKAEKLHPGDPVFAYSAGLCYCKLGYFEEALPQLENAKKSSKIKTQKANLNYLLGQCYHATMKFDKAIEYFEIYKQKMSKDSQEVLKAEMGIRFCKNAIELVKNPLNVRITNLGNNINSEHPDYYPMLPVDESILIFTSRREHETHKGRDPKDDKYFENIYINVKSGDNKWTTPTPVSSIINTPSHDACIGLSADGSQLYLFKPDNGGDIFVSNLLGAIWSEPKSLGPNINSPAWEPCMSISADGKTIFFISNRKPGIGGNDIYMSRKQNNGEFGPAILLSNKINTKENEFSPFIHPDGKTLYFSSKGYNSMGGYDIFSCTINTETGELLSPPVNVGYPINTTGDDDDFIWSADNKRAFFSSVREEGYGEEDIYVLERETKSDVDLCILKGRVINCSTNEPIPALITVTDNLTHEILGNYTSNSFTGKYVVVLPGGINYNLMVNAEGFSYHIKNIDIPTGSKYSEINDTICLMEVKPGTFVNLRSVKYEGDMLAESSYKKLDRLVQMLATNPEMKISVNVYPDSEGDEHENLELTEKRAKSVRDYIVSKGIESVRIYYKGYGKTKVPNDKEEVKNLKDGTEVEVLK